MTLSRCPTPTMRFSRCHHLTRPWQSGWRKTRNTTLLKRCSCHENCNSSSENDAKVLRLSHGTTFDTLYETCSEIAKCHACQTGYDTFETFKSDHFCSIRHGHSGLTRTVADASATSSEHSETRTLAMHSGKNKTDPRVCWLQSRVAFTAVAGCGCRLNHVRSGLLQFQTQRGKVSPICPGTGIESHHSFSWKSVHMTTTPTGIQPTCF